MEYSGHTSMEIPLRSIALCGLFVMIAHGALADAAASEACKAELSPVGQEIYTTALAENIDMSDGKELLTQIVERLVGEGKLPLDDARAEGVAAAKCLELLR